MRIGFCGTVSVGKTSLVNELAKLDHFEEYNVRTERSKYLISRGIPVNTDSTVRGQMVFMSERSVEMMNEKILTDRTIWDVCAFTIASNEIKNTHKEYLITAGMLLRPYYDHVFYVSPEGVEIEDNGIRITDSEYRNKIDNNIKRLLENYKPNKLTTIQGSMEERIAQVLDAVGNTDLPF